MAALYVSGWLTPLRSEASRQTDFSVQQKLRRMSPLLPSALADADARGDTPADHD